MKKNQRRCIEVFAHWEGLSEATFIGFLYASPGRGSEIFSFDYDKNWLRSAQAQVLDPSLQLFHGTQFAPLGKMNFGAFLDSSPDRWGRVLMDRREAQLARTQGRKMRQLLESDYLLGVYDEHRMGALRFRTDPKGPFLDNNKKLASPPWSSLRELEHASLELEKSDSENNPNFSTWLEMLIAPGSSLGGARPKASVTDENENLWIAKFPSNRDTDNIGAWEMVIHKLAEKAGIWTAESEVRKFNSSHFTFLTKRFDRTKNHKRIHFASAMTLLGRSDGDDGSKGANYLELAKFIIQQGANPTKDLEQLWRRIVFFMCVSNIDDHLRNHGFMLFSKGWVLSPAYDMNPIARGNGVTTPTAKP